MRYKGIIEEADCPDPVAQPKISASYFISFIIIGAYLVLTLFVGVVTAGMEEATSEQEEERIASEMMTHVAADYGLDPYTVNLWRQVFHALDLDSSGEIHEVEMKVVMTVMGQRVSTKDIQGHHFHICCFTSRPNQIYDHRASQLIGPGLLWRFDHPSFSMANTRIEASTSLSSELT